MRRYAAALVLASLACSASSPVSRGDQARWEAQAAAVSITRDDWGIAHVHGKTDADAVFGMIYAQAEDDFNRVETNYLNAMGRLAEAEGESAIYRDLRMKLFIDPDTLRAQYASAPDSLKVLMDAWADGLNFFLAKHPEVKPRVLTHFEPWMALSFSEGSIGGDIESVSLDELQAFYGRRSSQVAVRAVEKTPSGSNGIAIAPAKSASGAALLLINPHTSFFFRSELQVTSEQGLNAYGAATWGQFFIYQGFNEHAGWMHTSSGADAIDEYAETISARDSGFVYRFGTEERPVAVKKIRIPYKTSAGMQEKSFVVFGTHHGPVVRQVDGKWITVKLMQNPVAALTQSYWRTKSRNYQTFKATMELHTNSSNNTVFADGEGNIAYFHANFIPKRDTAFDWTKPVDGSNPATEWQGLHSVDESAGLLNPPIGWIQNTNNWPYSAAGPDSPKPTNFPNYFDRAGENPRGIHAMRVLTGRKGFTLDSLIAAAYDPDLPAFDNLIPALVDAYDKTPKNSPVRAAVAEAVDLLRGWDRRWAVGSVPTSVAVYWGEEMWRTVRADAESEQMDVYSYIAKRTTPQARLDGLKRAMDKLTQDFGSWKTPWGEINRFQRLTDDIVHPFADSGASIPVAFTSARWGSLASFQARSYNGSKRIYGTSGNSFVAVVEFGPRLRAKAVTAGGESGDPRSKHFNDQAERYAKGALRDVYFYPDELTAHTERRYKPGER